MTKGVIGASLLFEPGRRLLSFGLSVNALIVVLYIFTHTIEVLVGFVFFPLPIDAWGVGATMAESVAVVILSFLRRDMPRIQRGKERKGTKKRDTETARRNQRKCGVDAPAATGIITRLEQYGLVERRHDREDRPIVKVYLTDEGRDISHTLVSSVEHFELRMKRGFSES